MFGATHSIQFINNVLIFSTLFEITLLFSESTDEELEGMLARKHEWESVSKKAANRSGLKFIVFLTLVLLMLLSPPTPNS